ncbi:MAG: tRNA (guanine(10)-N(2))-dimethyltransferase [Candidatus Bathyarchaeia archaeon]
MTKTEGNTLDFGFPIKIIQEGSANIIIPKFEVLRRGAWNYVFSRAPVFYNPRMKICRDIAVLALQSYQRIVNRELKVSEPLAGCGVRGIRFAKEVNGVSAVYINDINEKAYAVAQYNINLNKLFDRVFASNEDANLFLARYAAPKKRFDFIDIDPFGSPVPYLDSAIRALRDGGLLALTATDMAPLCGVYPRVALRKYGGLSLRTEYCHEIAVRLLAGCLTMTAAKYNIGVKIVFSHSTDYYIRLYAQISYGAKSADKSLEEMGYILHCFKCLHREVFREAVLARDMKCKECGSPLKAAGPLWIGEIVDKDFYMLMEDSLKSLNYVGSEVQRIISLIKDEVGAPATYYVIDKICDKIGAPTPSLKNVINIIREMSFTAVRTHFHNRGIKTNAPASLVTTIVKEAAGLK